MFYIIGLGNPGEKYEKTRHNVGRMVLEKMSDDWSFDKNSNSLVSRIMSNGEVVELHQPETYMNKSGETIKYLVNKREADISNIIVVHDDIDLPLGQIKVAQSRGAGGNNGISSIINHLGSKNFVRIRVGIAPKSFWTGKMKRPVGGGPLERFVLKPFTMLEQKQLSEALERSQKAIDTIVKEGVVEAMNRFN